MTPAEHIAELARSQGVEREVVRLLTSDNGGLGMVAEVRAVVREELRAHLGEKSSALTSGRSESSQPYYTVAEVAEMFQVKAPTVRDWIKRKELGAELLPRGRVYRISVTEVKAFRRRRASRQSGTTSDLDSMADKIVNIAQRRAERGS